MGKMRTEALRPGNWDRSRLAKHLSDMRGQKILVIGDVGIDRYTIGNVERISPEAPVPIVAVEEQKLKLGLAANVADNVQALGGIPLLVGVLGHDREAEDFKKLARSSKILTNHLVSDKSRRTVLKERVVSERQQLLRIDYENRHEVSGEVEKKLLSTITRLLPQIDAVIVEDYGKGMLTSPFLRKVLSLLKRSGVWVAVDPSSSTPVENYRFASILTPNTKEAENLSGVRIHNVDSLCQAGLILLKATASKHVVITRGKEGMAIFTSGSPTVRLIPTFAREVYDVSGAGDTVISTLTLAIAAGSSIEEAVVLGNLAAGVEVGKRGTATVTVQEMTEAMDTVVRW